MVDLQLPFAKYMYKDDMNSVGLLKQGPFSVPEPEKHMEGWASVLLACPRTAGEVQPRRWAQ